MFLDGLLLAFESNAHMPIVPILFGLSVCRSSECETLGGALGTLPFTLPDTLREAAGALPRLFAIVLPCLEGAVTAGDGGPLLGEPEAVVCAELLCCVFSRIEPLSVGDSAPF